MIALSHWAAARHWNIPCLYEHFSDQMKKSSIQYTVTTNEEKKLFPPWEAVTCKILPEEGSIVIHNGVPVVSIELLFIQLSFLLNDGLASILLGCLLCLRGPNQEPPLSNVAKLRAYAQKAHYLYGRPRALYALQYVNGPFYSPMEINKYLTFSLPQRLGGHGFRGFTVVNGVVPITRQETNELGQSERFLRPDLMDPNEKIIIEYDGVANHSTSEQKAHDERRRRILKNHGYMVIVITKDDLFYLDKLALIRDRIARRLERRIRVRTPKFFDYFIYLRNHLPKYMPDNDGLLVIYMRSMHIRIRRL